MRHFLEEMIKAGMLGLFGGLANYFYYIEKNRKAFRVGGFLTAGIISYFVGVVAGEFLPDDDKKDGFLMLAGFCCYPILGFIEARVEKHLKKKELI